MELTKGSDATSRNCGEDCGTFGPLRGGSGCVLPGMLPLYFQDIHYCPGCPENSYRKVYNTGYYIVRSDYCSQLFKLRRPKYHCEKILIELHNTQLSFPFWIFHSGYSIDDLVYGLANCLTSIASMVFLV